MKTFAIDTLGCKVNQYESQQVRQFLERTGLKYVPGSQKHDLSIINTCCVTSTASAKSRQCIRRAKKQNPDSKVVVFGCLAAAESNSLTSLLSDLILIRHRSTLTAKLSQIISEKAVTTTPNNSQCYENTDITSIKPIKAEQINPKSCDILTKLPELTSFYGHTRAFLKVQDGCDSHCSYCIIPKCRPNVQSKSVESAVAEAKQLVKAGHKEIIVTGIFLGAFGQETTIKKHWPSQENPKLAELVRLLALIPHLSRIRLSSLEPSDVTERLLDVICENKNIMPHLHLSLQSGSDRILRRMCRRYDTELYLKKVEQIKSSLKNPAITTDIIVGFPGETDDDFKRSLKMAQDVGFSRIHVFCFSPRQGTAAFKMTPKIKPQVIKERAGILGDLAKKLAYQYRQRLLGQSEKVLIENTENGCAIGHAERYFEVQIPNPPAYIRRNDIVKVNLTANSKTTVTGRLDDNFY